MANHASERTPPDLGPLIDRLTHRRTPAGRGTPAAGATPLGFHRVLLALDDSESAQHALAWARQLAVAFDASVTVLHAVLPERTYDELVEILPGQVQAHALFSADEAQGQRLVDDAVAALRSGGVAAHPKLAFGFPQEEILRLAREGHHDLVVLGSHGRGRAGRLLLGSVVDQVKNRVAASVLIAKTPPPAGRILAATDGSPPSKRSAAIAVRLAHRLGVHALILHVVPSFGFEATDETRRAARVAVADLDTGHGDPSVRFDVEFGYPPERIAASAADRGCGLVVVGSRGLGGLRGLVAGSVSNRVAHESPVSVLLVKAPLRSPSSTVRDSPTPAALTT